MTNKTTQTNHNVETNEMVNETKQSAVEQFAIALYEKGFLKGNGDEIQKLLEKHIEIERKRLRRMQDQSFRLA